MIKFICHPVLIQLLEHCKVDVICQQCTIDVVIVSDFFPQGSIHGGLIEAVNYRLTHPTYYILITSFYSKEELLKYDIFGILSLHGTVFIRLPFMVEELYTALEKHTDVELSIPKEEWILFSTNACKALLKEKISVLKHGNKLDFVNNITGPLRAAAVCSSSFPELLTVVKQYLQSVKFYTAKEEIAELFLLASASAPLPDTFLQSVSHFANGLRQLEMHASQEDINIKQLISEIDILNETSSKIQTQ